MAHLVRCWCRRIYRCEVIKHPHSCFGDVGHDDCPDELLHGPHPPASALFLTISAPLFRDSYKEKLLTYKFPIQEVLESNSLKRIL